MYFKLLDSVLRKHAVKYIRGLRFNLRVAHLLIASMAFLTVLFATSVLSAQEKRLLFPGSTVVTGFSNSYEPNFGKNLPAGKLVEDETFIDPSGTSASIFLPDNPGFAWDGRAWDLPYYFNVLAGEVGQVFGIAIDAGWPENLDGSVEPPNVYLTATSAFGLNIVTRDTDNNGLPERVIIGQPGANFMKAQFGNLQGSGHLFGQRSGPGSIYKLDGRTGEVSLFANITLNGQDNTGPALGNIAFDPENNQLFVSDRDTGLIHRFDLDGNELGYFDHGVEGRVNAGFPANPLDVSNRLDVTDFQFDSEDPETWSYADPKRRIWGLAVQKGRLYYAVAGGPQIWSVGIDSDTGAFLSDPRWELDVWPEGPNYEVSDIVFNARGAMILAQRGQQVARYDYSSFMKPRRARVYRYWLESPDDPATKSRWQLEPEEYAIGFQPNYRNAAGGVDLGPGYDDFGEMKVGKCKGTLWATGDSLRTNQQLRNKLLEGGELNLRGIQGSPADLVRDHNSPPWTSYLVDYDGQYQDPQTSGQMGDVEVYAPCDGGTPVDIVFTKTAGLTTFIQQTGFWSLSYIFNILNAGDPFAPTSFIEVSDQPPIGTSIIGVSGDNWQCNQADFPIVAPNTLDCSYNYGGGVLGTGEKLVPLEVEVTTEIKGHYNNCAVAMLNPLSGFLDISAKNNRSCGDNSTSQDIEIEKKAGPVEYDQQLGLWVVKYTLEVQNVGNSFYPSSDIEIFDLPPNGLSVSNVAGTNWVCNTANFPITAPNNLSCTYNYGTGLFATGAYLEPLHIELTASGPGQYVNCASVDFNNSTYLYDDHQQNNESCAENGNNDTTLTIKKEFEGEILAWLPGNAIFPMNVLCTDGTSVTVNLDFSNSGVETVSGIAIGSQCTVTEGNPQNVTIPANCEWAATYQPVQPVEMLPGDVSVVVTNYLDCTPNITDISIKKEVERVYFDPKSGPAGQWIVDFVLTVTNNGATLPAGHTFEITDPVPGGLSISSANGVGWSCLSSFPINSGNVICTYVSGQSVPTGGSIDSLSVQATGVSPGSYENCAIVHLTNPPNIQETTYANNESCITVTLEEHVETTSLTVTKELDEILQSPTLDLSNTVFQVNVSCLPSGYTDTLLLNVLGGLTDTASGIPVGDTCTIAELLPPAGNPLPPSYIWYRNYPLGNTITMVQNSNNLLVFNGLYQNVGASRRLTLAKTFDFSAVQQAPNLSGVNFTVETTCSSPVLTPPGAFYLFQLNSGNGFTATQGNIPFGSTCTISEVQPPDLPGCSWAAPVYPNGQVASQAALAAGNVVLEVKNICLPESNQETRIIVKKVEIIDGQINQGGLAYLYSGSCALPNGATQAGTDQIGWLSTGASYQRISVVPVGSVCSITETPPPVPAAYAAEGCVWQTTYRNRFNQGSWSNGANITTQFDSNGIDNTIEIRNILVCPAKAPKENVSPDLKITKNGPQKCEAGRICTFLVKVSNVGTAPYVGPAIVTDSTRVSGVKLSTGGNGNGWSCSGKGGKLATCVNPTLSLQPGQSTTFSLPVRLPRWLQRGSIYENCAEISDSKKASLESPVLVTQLMLNALGFNSGSADGVDGRNTRAAVNAYRSSAGLAADGGINAELLAKLLGGRARDSNPANNKSCASTKVTKKVKKVQKKIAPRATKPKDSTPACILPRIYDVFSGRCINIIELLPSPPKRGGGGALKRP
ncbi:MAG: hypothetical protein GXP05_14170 [Alphaproteobacteria bacterium]|nr:hypothetical protein [Alphaproteobacteria bacterium]